MEPQDAAPQQGSPDHRPQAQLEEDVSLHIFTASAAMVGVCLTSIGLFRVVNWLGHLVDTLGDDLLAMDAFVFLAACVLAYVALRNRAMRRHDQIERLADALFLSGLGLMAMVCGLIVWAFV